VKKVCLFSLIVVVLIVVLLIVAACGYHNPNIYNGPSKTIYLAEWKNRTSRLGLDSQIYRSLTRWFQKSKSISTVRKKEGADLILAGEFISQELPSLSYGANSTTTEVKIKLRLRYILKEISSNKIVIEVPNAVWTEEYLTSSSSTSNLNNEREALETIIEDLSKIIYQRTITEIPKL
jgi:outer membrane lipopolysaccharide assembly protein LptE/RlpB